MKVLAINGSPTPKGNTFRTLNMVAEELANNGIETEIINVGTQVISGCKGCGVCYRQKDDKCIINDNVNEIFQKAKEADGILIGSPVHFAGMSGAMKSFCDRFFSLANANDGAFRHKVGASVVAVRRSGGVTTFNELNNFLNYAEMFLISSNYWNVIHGRKPDEVEQDGEGKQIMRVLGSNMAWLMKAIENSKDIPKPEKESKVNTSFIR